VLAIEAVVVGVEGEVVEEEEAEPVALGRRRVATDGIVLVWNIQIQNAYLRVL
jgi:hypothetical protein